MTYWFFDDCVVESGPGDRVSTSAIRVQLYVFQRRALATSLKEALGCTISTSSASIGLYCLPGNRTLLSLSLLDKIEDA